jgi:hypothetical protein
MDDTHKEPSMSVSLYRLSVPVYLRGFAVLSDLLQKAEAYAADTGIDPADLLNARLAPDMLPLSGQIQRASDTTKGSIGRLTALEMPRFEDNEASFADLHARIAKTVAVFEGVTEADMADSAGKTVSLNFGKLKVELNGTDYLLQFVLPNFFFHITTTHDILRHNGLSIGKLDYLGF